MHLFDFVDLILHVTAVDTREWVTQNALGVIALTRGRHEPLWNGDMEADGTMDKWTVFVIARGSGSRHSSVAVTQEPASIRKLVAQNLGGKWARIRARGIRGKPGMRCTDIINFRRKRWFYCTILWWKEQGRLTLAVKHNFFFFTIVPAFQEAWHPLSQ